MTESKKKALIVDDETVVRAFVSAVLEDEGWDTTQGRDGEEAVALAIQEDPDVVVLDLMMPGKDGFETLHELREETRTAHIPVVMLSAINEYELGSRCDVQSVAERAGTTAPQAFVEKPLDSAKILDAVAEAAQR